MNVLLKNRRTNFCVCAQLRGDVMEADHSWALVNLDHPQNTKHFVLSCHEKLQAWCCMKSTCAGHSALSSRFLASRFVEAPASHSTEGVRLLSWFLVLFVDAPFTCSMSAVQENARLKNYCSIEKPYYIIPLAKEVAAITEKLVSSVFISCMQQEVAVSSPLIRA